VEKFGFGANRAISLLVVTEACQAAKYAIRAVIREHAIETAEHVAFVRLKRLYLPNSSSNQAL
jgi:hypothetical protein